MKIFLAIVYPIMVLAAFILGRNVGQVEIMKEWSDSTLKQWLSR